MVAPESPAPTTSTSQSGMEEREETENTPVLVVAAYRENLAWLKDVPPEYQILVYIKSDPTDSKCSYHTIPLAWREVAVRYLPNVGREGDTWLAFVLEHYDALPFARAIPLTTRPTLSAC